MPTFLIRTSNSLFRGEKIYLPLESMLDNLTDETLLVDILTQLIFTFRKACFLSLVTIDCGSFSFFCLYWHYKENLLFFYKDTSLKKLNCFGFYHFLLCPKWTRRMSVRYSSPYLRPPEKRGTDHQRKNLTMTPQQGPKRTSSQGHFFHLEKHFPVSLM